MAELNGLESRYIVVAAAEKIVTIDVHDWSGSCSIFPRHYRCRYHRPSRQRAGSCSRHVLHRLV